MEHGFPTMGLSSPNMEYLPRCESCFSRHKIRCMWDTPISKHESCAPLVEYHFPEWILTANVDPGSPHRTLYPQNVQKWNSTQ